ncbi:MAG: radical SAM protein [Candidatus Diapherotrites archaeon]|nr:radical SAM protein [Candidatus Diapherotrites archaeon]
MQANKSNLENNSYTNTNAATKAIEMKRFVENFLANPLSRKILWRITKNNRLERILNYYAHKNTKKIKLGLSDYIIYLIVKLIIDRFKASTALSDEIVMQHLSDGVWRKGVSLTLEGIAKFGLRKPFITTAPFLVVWNVTKICNLRWKHCYENADVKAENELTTAEALKAVDKMAEAGVAYIALSGGEPLMRKDWYKIARRIKKHEMGFSIATNGTLLTKENVKKLKKANCLYVQVSLDAANKKLHNYFRGANTFERTIEGIQNLVEEGITTGIASTITRLNYNEVPKLIDLAENLGVDIWMHYNFIPVGRGTEIRKLDITANQREKLLQYIAKRSQRSKISLLSTAPQYARVCMQTIGHVKATHFDVFSDKDESIVGYLADFIGGCGAGRLYCAVEPDGTIEPCVFMPIRIGNILHDDLRKLWVENEILNKIRNRESFDVCSSCDFRNVCGGCRARSYAYFGRVDAADTGCINYKKKNRKRKLTKIAIRKVASSRIRGKKA